ncbi:MAG: hypothetical protein RLZZ480_124 [Candidatus Parcubacteria bacterium]|jgi:hypothetical protein
MKRFSEQLHSQARSVKLQANEKQALRERVVSYMEYHPMPESVTKRVPSPVKMVSMPGYNMVQIPFSILIKWSVAVSAFVLVVLPMLAERSMPGDSLYAVKVRFNEEVRSTLTLNSYEKVEWETERLNRRIAEARLLASEGKLTDEVEADIAAAVKEHTQIVQAEISELREKDADQATLASIELSTTLELQSASLQEEGNTTLALAVSEAASDNPAQMVVDVINESLSAQEDIVDAAAIPAYDKIMARVEMNTTRAYELLTSLHLSTEDQLQHDITRRLEDVSRTIEAAKVRKTDNESEASELLLNALERTQKLIVYMSDVEGNRGIALESVVSIILTEEESQREFERLSAEINHKKELLVAAKPELSLEAVEKVTYTLSIVADNEAKNASSTSASESLSRAKESDAVLSDMLLLVKAEGVTPVLPTVEMPAPVTEASTTASVIDEEVTEAPPEE